MAVAEALAPREGAGTHDGHAVADVACDHCGLPVPAGLAAGGDRFCCSGCATAYAVIREVGLGGYYDLPQRRGAAVRTSGRGFEEFDHEAFEALYVRTDAAGGRETELHLEGVHCASCVWLVERTPRAVPGLAAAELDVPRARVRVRWDPARVRLSEIARALDRLGYRPHPYRGMAADLRRRRDDRAMLVRLGVAGAIAGNVMTVALALYSGAFGDMEHEVVRYFRWVSLALTTPAIVWPGRVFFRGAWAALRAGTFHMDQPIALALGAGFVRGAINTVTDRGPIYFDGVATLIFLLLVGRFLQQRAQRAAADSAELLASMIPATARRVDDGGATREVPIESLLPGMRCEVRAGETVPADGRVVDGVAALDRSLLTGESRWTRVGPGDAVHAGTVSRDGTLRLVVEESGESSRLGRILDAVAAGAARRAPLVRLADRMAGGFVGVVLALAALTWWSWAPRSDQALDHAIALLIVTCPCALALATPLAVTSAIGRAARAGILVKGGDALERLATPGLLVLDKTGTVTEGRTTLARWEGDDAVRAGVLAIERHSTHPLALGFQTAWPDVAVPEAVGVRSTLGGGVEGRVEGRHVVVGSPRFVAAHLATGAPVVVASDGGWDALTPVWVAVDGDLVARAGFGDPVRADARSALDALRARGWRTRLLSGDDARVVAVVGRALGFAPAHCRGGATPEDKLAAIEAWEREGPVVMVGDGVNDAAAIARASVGVGVRGGAEACLAAADVYLTREGLRPLVALIRGAERTLGAIRFNIGLSLIYNAAGVVLAMTGRIDPLIAAVVMPVSSLTVVLTSWRARTFDEPRP